MPCQKEQEVPGEENQGPEPPIHILEEILEEWHGREVPEKVVILPLSDSGSPDNEDN